MNNTSSPYPSSVGVVRDKVEGAQEEVHARIAAGTSAVKSTTDSIANRAHGAVDGAANAVGNVADKVDSTVQGATDALNAAADGIRSNPLLVVGGALTLGYLLGRLSR